MTKDEAIIEMKNGKKLTHRFFVEGEWIARDVNPKYYKFEDGILCSSYEFWSLRDGLEWDTGWSLYNEA